MPLTDDGFLKSLPEVYRARRLVVGFSGGHDSMVLLHLCVALKERGLIKTLEAIHVNHGLSPNADIWQGFCEGICQRWSVPMVSRQAVVNRGTGEGLEASARVARYQLYEGFLQSGDCLLQAHHRNDQAETLLYRMVRGCGVHGLAAIPRERVLGEAVILRPLLDVSRDAVHAYAKVHKLEWVDDESNSDVAYDRNFLRHNVLPQLTRRWPGGVSNIGRLAEDAADVVALLDQTAEIDLQQTLSDSDILFLHSAQALDITRLITLSEYRQRNLLRYWLRGQGFPLPSRAGLQRILDELALASRDACPVVAWEGCEVRRHGGRIVAMRPVGVLHPFCYELDVKQSDCLVLPGNGRIDIAAGYGGQHVSMIRPGIKGLSVGYRSGVEVAPFRLQGRQGSKSLKKWLNTLSVPVWVRSRLPILHVAGELVAIPGLLANADYAVARNEPGVQLDWHYPFGRQG